MRIIAATVVGTCLGLGGVVVTGLAAGTLNLRATGYSSFNTKALTTTRGTVTLAMVNRNAERHNIAVRGRGIKTRKGLVVGRGKTSSVTVTLKPGTYTFFCSVPGHEGAGMKGTLTIK